MVQLPELREFSSPYVIVSVRMHLATSNCACACLSVVRVRVRVCVCKCVRMCVCIQESTCERACPLHITRLHKAAGATIQESCHEAFYIED